MRRLGCFSGLLIVFFPAAATVLQWLCTNNAFFLGGVSLKITVNLKTLQCNTELRHFAGLRWFLRWTFECSDCYQQHRRSVKSLSPFISKLSPVCDLYSKLHKVGQCSHGLILWKWKHSLKVTDGGLLRTGTQRHAVGQTPHFSPEKSFSAPQLASLNYQQWLISRFWSQRVLFQWVWDLLPSLAWLCSLSCPRPCGSSSWMWSGPFGPCCAPSSCPFYLWRKPHRKPITILQTQNHWYVIVNPSRKYRKETGDVGTSQKSLGGREVMDLPFWWGWSGFPPWAPGPILTLPPVAPDSNTCTGLKSFSRSHLQKKQQCESTCIKDKNSEKRIIRSFFPMVPDAETTGAKFMQLAATGLIMYLVTPTAKGRDNTRVNYN